MAKTIIHSDGPIEHKLAEAIQIITKLSKYHKIWKEHFGAQNRNNLERWYAKAEEYLASIVITETDEQSNSMAMKNRTE
jgi:hypothetical protein